MTLSIILRKIFNMSMSAVIKAIMLSVVMFSVIVLTVVMLVWLY
jgi:hypothetical protein